MLRFQEDTARHLFRMQIIGPDGTPIETAEQLAAAQAAQQQAAQQQAIQQQRAIDAPAPPVIPTRAPSTTIDALEREFQKKKERELNAARQAGGNRRRCRPPQDRRKSRPQRQVPLRLRQKVQKLPRRRSLALLGKSPLR